MLMGVPTGQPSRRYVVNSAVQCRTKGRSDSGMAGVIDTVSAIVVSLGGVGPTGGRGPSVPCDMRHAYRRSAASPVPPPAHAAPAPALGPGRGFPTDALSQPRKPRAISSAATPLGAVTQGSGSLTGGPARPRSADPLDRVGDRGVGRRLDGLDRVRHRYLGLRA